MGVIILFLAWAAFVVAAGSGVNPLKLNHEFQQTGTFGDSFGAFSAIMTALAAVFAYGAFTETREENRRLRRYQEDLDISDARRDSEQTFFRLLDLRLAIIRDISISDQNETYQGTDALHEIFSFISHRVRSGEMEPAKGYESAYRLHRNDLGHYFRFTYHIIRFAVEHFNENIDRYEYIRLLRAQLSNSEQCLIALNCLYGDGQTKFKPWVEEFALLHNMDEGDKTRLGLEAAFDPEAFGSPASDR